MYISKKLFTASLLATLFILVFAVSAFAEAPELKASSAILAMTDGEQILFEKNPDARVSPSGLTKLMTALTAYDESGGDMDAVIIVPENIKELYNPLEQNIALRPGEEITVGSLIQAIIVGSANDAAIALAVHCGGSSEGFAEMMNAKAEGLGLTDTHFVNPTGNYSEVQYTTAYDLLKIYKEILKIPPLQSAAQTANTKIEATNASAILRVFCGY